MWTLSLAPDALVSGLGPTTEVYEGRQATLAGTSGARLVDSTYSTLYTLLLGEIIG